MTNSKKSVLVVEDNNSSYLLALAILQNEYDVIHVTNGIDAINEVKSKDIEFIIMDLKLPKMDGFEATKRIREFNTTIPIIALTAYAYESDKETAKDAGCTAYLVKPIRKIDLHNIINEFIKS